VAMTLEMPFKDHDDLADALQGWSAERSMRLGEDCMATLAQWVGERLNQG
jgi:murein tripeptide amidase MpaA